jgi:hypothetical protein
MTKADLKAPFPYFGGKRAVADLVWPRLGNVANYVEPFCGSAAMLLCRPDAPNIETVNDADCYVANFWRATQAEPEAVADWCNHPVNECDLHARHRWLVLSPEAAEFRERMRTDPAHYDAKVAGWWCWGLCCWIGSGWCSVQSAEVSQLPLIGDPPRGGHRGADGEGRGLSSQVPAGQRPLTGVHTKGKHGPPGGSGDKRPFIGGLEDQHGRGINIKRPRAHRAAGSSNSPCQLPGVLGGDPNLTDGNRPQLADARCRGRGVNSNDDAGTCEERRTWLVDWFSRLRDRLRTVRVCCGHWLRVCDSESVTTRLGTTGVFFDAPYRVKLKCGKKNRDGNLYATDSNTDEIVDGVIAYCLERGGNSQMRIAACCYEGEGYETLLEHGWECVAWASQGGYGNRSEAGRQNAKRERIFFSPHCVQENLLF